MRESHECATPLINWSPKHKLTQEYQALYTELSRPGR